MARIERAFVSAELAAAFISGLSYANDGDITTHGFQARGHLFVAIFDDDTHVEDQLFKVGALPCPIDSIEGADAESVKLVRDFMLEYFRDAPPGAIPNVEVMMSFLDECIAYWAQ